MRYARGVSLIELLIGMAIGLMLVSGVLYVYQRQSENAVFQMNYTRFTQQMRDLGERMAMDIRRAGYLGYLYHANATTMAVDNPFASGSIGGITTDLTISNQTSPDVEASNSCITYAYNLDDDYPVLVGAQTTSMGTGFDADNMELFGFKLASGSIWMRTGMGASTNFNCNDGEWALISEPGVANITGLGFTLASTTCTNITDAGRNDCDGTLTPADATDDPVSGDLMVVVREVAITLSGQSARDPEQTMTLTKVVDLPNDRVFVEP